MPFYDRFSLSIGTDQERTIRCILERLWDMLDGPVPIDVENLIGQCIGAMLPDDEGEWTVDRAGAEDALAALAYALRCWKTGDPQESVWAARRACEAVSFFIENQPGAEANARQSASYDHPLEQTELARQRRDIDDLLQGEITTSRLRARAQADALSVIGADKERQD